MRRVVEPLLGGAAQTDFSARDFEYVRDLGLVAHDDPLRIANPIYAEVIPRELTAAVQRGIAQEAAWYVDADGGLDVDKLMEAFQAFFREHSEHWVERFEYREAGAAVALAGVPATHREQRGSHRARVRSGSGPDGSAHRVAAGQGVRGGMWWSARCCAGVWRRRSETE